MRSLTRTQNPFPAKGMRAERPPGILLNSRGAFPAAALRDQSADWTLARQEGFFPRHMSLEKIFGLGESGTGDCFVVRRSLPGVTEGRFFSPTCGVTKKPSLSPAFHEGTSRLLRRWDKGDGSFVTSKPCGDGTKEPSPCHTGCLRAPTRQGQKRGATIDCGLAIYSCSLFWLLSHRLPGDA